MTWKRGRAEIEGLLSNGELERVEPAARAAERLLDEADAHIGSATTIVGHDPAGALQLSYDAARKASAALLAAQGIRATTRGGHIAVLDAVRAQFDNQGGIEVFGRLHRLRRRRNATEYPDTDTPSVTEEDARWAIDLARRTVDAARGLMRSGRLDRFE